MTAEPFLSSHAERWQATLRDLVGLRSVFEHEHAIQDYVARAIAALGLPVERVAHARDRLTALPHAQPPFSDVPNRHSLVTRIDGTGGGRSFLLSAHLDVVPEGDRDAWTHDPFAGEVDDRGFIYGRGVMDDKAGAAISLAVMEALTVMPIRLRGDVIFHYVLENETTGNGSLLCLEAGHRADAAAIIDGTRPDRLIDEHAGQLQFELFVKGRPASVAVSHMGRNAAELMARLVLELRDVVHALNDARTPPWTQFPSPFQLSVQRVHSEGAQLTVPHEAFAQCYVTFAPPFTLAGMRDVIAQTVRRFDARFELETPVSVLWSGLAAEPVRSDARELAQAIVAAARRAGLPDVVPGPSTGTSDLRHFARAGIPCVLYGPGTGYNPHRADEHYLLSDLVKIVAIYLDVLSTWCGRAETA